MTIDLEEMGTAERVHFGISKGEHGAAVLGHHLKNTLKFTQQSRILMPLATLPVWAVMFLGLGSNHVV